jgi:hypothetical protein
VTVGAGATLAGMGRGLVASLLVLAACSHDSGSSNSFASQICAKLSGCNIEPSNCQAAYSAIVLSSSCQSTMLSASCADLTAPSPPAPLAACFPACTGTMSCGGTVTSTTCNSDDTLTECNSGNQYVYSCSGVCAAESKSYSGTCTLTYDEETSPTGCPECWCD